jgi:hypothetical protein
MYEETESIICLDNCPPQDPDSNLNGEKDTWIKKAISIGDGAGSSGVYSVNAGPSNYDTSHLGSMQQFHPLGSLGLVAVGGDFNLPEEAQNIAAFKLAGEKIWHSADTQPHGFRSAVAYYPTTKTWITVGPNGTDISTDDGRNWRALRPNPALNEPSDADRDWNALSLPFVVGPRGRIGKLQPEALNPTQPSSAKTAQP